MLKPDLARPLEAAEPHLPHDHHPAQCRHLSGGSTMQTLWTTPSGVYWPERISRLDLNTVTDDNAKDNEAGEHRDGEGGPDL